MIVWTMVKTVFFVESEEKFALCPKCGEQLTFHCWISRPSKDSTGSKSIYIIRVLKCGNEACPTTYHRELPDIIIPYKRYNTQAVEEALEQDNSHVAVAADGTTIWRWRKWFETKATNIVMALISVAVTVRDDADSSSLAIQNQKIDNPIETIKTIVSRKVKWLNEAVRILVNSSKWVFNCSAYLSG